MCTPETIFRISLVLLILQTIYFNSSGMPNEHILLFNEHKLLKIDSSDMPDECIFSFNERICNLMNEFHVDEFCYQKSTIIKALFRNQLVQLHEAVKH